MEGKEFGFEGKELGLEINFLSLGSAKGRVAEENIGREFDRCRVQKKKNREEHDEGKQRRTVERGRNMIEGTVWDTPYGIDEYRNISRMDQNTIL